MRVSTKNLQDTCSFIVNACRREVKANPSNRVMICASHRNQFKALSLLLVGFSEKQFIQGAIEQINCIEHSKQKPQEAA